MPGLTAPRRDLPDLACLAVPRRAEPDPDSPCLPCQTKPCLALPRPRLPSRATPSLASPFLDVPRHASPALPDPASPGRASPCPACPATPCLTRSSHAPRRLPNRASPRPTLPYTALPALPALAGLSSRRRILRWIVPADRLGGNSGRGFPPFRCEHPQALSAVRTRFVSPPQRGSIPVYPRY